MNHHERWDGTGYPNMLAGEDIPLPGRIVAIADVFDALTSVRPYKNAWPADEAMKMIRENRGKQFDPHLVDLLDTVLDRFDQIREQFKDSNGESG